jgi:capsular exopolysaccharide synthesis family protein
MTTSSDGGALAPYLRMLREHRVLIVLVVLVCAGATAAYSFTRESTYQSVAQLSFQEESQSNAVAGVAAQQVSTAVELAAKGAETVTSDEVLTQVKQRLGTPLSIDELRDKIEPQIDTSSNLVDVTATSDDPRFAAALANEVAQRAVSVQVRADRDRFKRIAARLQEELDQRLRGVAKNDIAGALAASSGYSDRLASLNTLAVSATPVKLTTAATVPGDPASPKPVRDTVIGAFVGLLLGLVLAFVRDALDRRLRDVTDIREHLELPVVGIIRREAFGVLPFVDRGDGPPDGHETEAFRSLRTNTELLDPEHRTRTVAITSPLPQEGKSTVAAGLALASASAGRRKILVECDLRRPCLAERFGLEPGPGLGDFLAGRATPAEVLRTVDLTEGVRTGDGDRPPQLVVVPAGEPTSSPTELLGSARFTELLEELAGVYELVVVDTAPVLAVADALTVVPAADAVLLCIRADQTTRNQAAAGKAAVQRVPDKRIAVVVTGVASHRDEDYEYYSSTYVQNA